MIVSLVFKCIVFSVMCLLEREVLVKGCIRQKNNNMSGSPPTSMDPLMDRLLHVILKNRRLPSSTTSTKSSSMSLDHQQHDNDGSKTQIMFHKKWAATRRPIHSPTRLREYSAYGSHKAAVSQDPASLSWRTLATWDAVPCTE